MTFDRPYSCTVRVPTRISISVLDMNRLEPGTPGGGNVGFAVAVPVTLSAWPSPRPMVSFVDDVPVSSRPDTKALLRYVLEAWSRLSGTDHSYELRVSTMPPLHVGLGCSSALQTAARLAMGASSGDSSLVDRAGRQLSHAYREVVKGDIIVGHTTGLASVLNVHGGFAATDESGDVITRVATPEWPVVLGRLPSAENFGEAERALLARCQALDARDRHAKRRIVDDDLIPSVEKGDLAQVGSAVALLQRMGSKVAEAAIYDGLAWQVMDTLHENGLECVFLSAVGPTVVAITERNPDEALTAAHAAGLEDVMLSHVDSTGMEISWHVDSEGL